MSGVLRAINLKQVLVHSIIGIVLGLILTFVPAYSLAETVIFVIAAILIVCNGCSLYMDVSKNESSNQTLLYVLGVLCGFVLLCFSSLLINILVFLYLVGEPLYRGYVSKWDKKVLLDNSPKFILGVILLISGIATVNIIFKILGVIVLIGSLLSLGVNCYFYRKSGVKIIK